MFASPFPGEPVPVNDLHSHPVGPRGYRVGRTITFSSAEATSRKPLDHFLPGLAGTVHISFAIIPTFRMRGTYF